MRFYFRWRDFRAAVLGATFFSAAAVMLAAAFPAVAQAALVAVTTVTCSVTGSNWCISGNNSSSGIGVIGTSKSGTGLRGTSTSQYGLKATSGSNVAILAQTTSGSNAITALGSSTGNGVNASAGGVGLSGTSTGTSAGSANVGVLGTAKDGTGVYGLSTGPDGTGGSFVGGGGGAIVGTAPANTQVLLLFNTTSANSVFEVTGRGDVYYHGGLHSFAKTIGGGTVRSFSPNSTQPTVEDTGTAQLVRGTGVVRLDPTFAASIEPAAGYRVFVTPDGETHELFVASKTAVGFVVREAQGGRSTVMFDYRIVATKFGEAGQHMAMVSSAEARTLLARVRLPAAPAVKLPTPVVEPVTP